MDKGLEKLLEDISLKLKQTLATASMGGDSPDVKLNRAIETCDTKEIKSILKRDTIARGITDLINENLRFGDTREEKRLEVTQTLLSCVPLLERDKNFQKGSAILNNIAKTHPDHGKLISNYLKKEEKISQADLWGRGGPS